LIPSYQKLIYVTACKKLQTYESICFGPCENNKGASFYDSQCICDEKIDNSRAVLDESDIRKFHMNRKSYRIINHHYYQLGMEFLVCLPFHYNNIRDQNRGK